MGSRGPVFVLATCAALGAGVLAAVLLDARRGTAPADGRSTAVARGEHERPEPLLDATEPREEVPAQAPAPAAVAAALDQRIERELPAGMLSGTVRDARGAALAGAQVTLERRPAATFDLLDLSEARKPHAVDETRTDRDGRFLFHLAIGTPVDVHAVLEGYSDAVRPDAYAGQELELVLAPGTLVHGVVTRARDRSPVADATVNVFAKGGPATLRRLTTTRADGSYELRVPMDRGVVEVVPALERCSDWLEFTAGPDGRVELDVALEDGLVVEGTVRDADTGLALENATVGEGWWYRRTATSDAAGRYRLPGFGDPGVLELYARASGYGESKIETLPAAEGGVLRVDWQLRRGRSVRGRVVTESGEPVPQAYVGAVASEFGDQGQRTDWIADHTDDEGRFALAGLAPDLGHALLLARHGFATDAYDLPASELTTPELDVGDLVLRPPALVAGRVLSPGGTGLAGIEVVLNGWNADRFRLSGPGMPRGQFYVDQREVATDAEGRFWFGDVSAGQYELSARVQGRPESRGRKIDVATGQRIEDLELVLDTAGVLRGRVQDENGRSLAGVFVSASAEHLVDPASGDRGGHVHDRTEADGSFELTGLAEGVYTVQAWPLEIPDVDPDTPFLSATLEHVSTGAQELVVVLPRGASIRGQLVDATGAPLVGYVVAVRVEDRQGEFSTTDLEGRFALTVVPGTSPDVEVRGAAQTSAFQTVFLVQPGVAAGTHDLVLRLP